MIELRESAKDSQRLARKPQRRRSAASRDIPKLGKVETSLGAQPNERDSGQRKKS